MNFFKRKKKRPRMQYYLELDDVSHLYSVCKAGKWYSPPSFSEIKDLLKQPWAMGYGARCSAEYLIKEIIPFVASEGISPFTQTELLKIAKQQPKINSDREKGIGTDAHKALRCYVSEGVIPVELSEGAQNCFNSYRLWEEENKKFIGKTVFTELPLYSPKYDFCFTGDRTLFFHNKLTYMDYKSSKDFYDLEIAIQCIANILGVEDNIENKYLVKYGLHPGMRFGSAGALLLDKKKGSIAIWKDYTEQLPFAEKIFLSLRKMFEDMRYYPLERFNKVKRSFRRRGIGEKS